MEGTVWGRSESSEVCLLIGCSVAASFILQRMRRRWNTRVRCPRPRRPSPPVPSSLIYLGSSRVWLRWQNSSGEASRVQIYPTCPTSKDLESADLWPRSEILVRGCLGECSKKCQRTHAVYLNLLCGGISSSVSYCPGSCGCFEVSRMLKYQRGTHIRHQPFQFLHHSHCSSKPKQVIFRHHYPQLVVNQH